MKFSIPGGVFFTLFLVLSRLPFGIGDAFAQSAEPAGKYENSCARAAQKQERENAIPAYLLRAMALAESGRWDSRKGENIAWPWTVTNGGQGRFFSTKAEAVAFVKALHKRGVQNIDVGCLQINLMYHPDAFASLQAAFNPDANAAYAAKILVQRQEQTTSWLQAAGNYHSTTHAFNNTYKIKVARLWNDIRSRAVAKMASRPPTPSLSRNAGSIAMRALPEPTDAAPADHTRALNAAFRARLASGMALLSRAAEHRRELDAWRESKVRAIAAEHQALMNRVRREQRELGILRGKTAPSRKDAFAERRQEQLRKWRENL